MFDQSDKWCNKMARPYKPLSSRKHSWARQINANQHELFLFTPEEFQAIIDSRPGHQQKRLRDYWAQHRRKMNNVAGYASSTMDSVALKRLLWDLGGFPKGVQIKAYERVANGQRYIVIKGFAGLRKVLTGTRYLVGNPTVVRMGLGQVGANSAILKGGVITIVALGAFRCIDYFLTDQATLGYLVGSLATDVVKLGITMAGSWVGASIMASAGFAIGPLAAVVFVGFIVGWGLGKIDERFNVTQQLVDTLDVQFEKIQSKAQSWRQFYENLPEHAESVAIEVLDYAMDVAKRAGVQWVEHHLNKLIRNVPRLM